MVSLTPAVYRAISLIPSKVKWVQLGLLLQLPSLMRPVVCRKVKKMAMVKMGMAPVAVAPNQLPPPHQPLLLHQLQGAAGLREPKVKVVKEQALPAVQLPALAVVAQPK